MDYIEKNSCSREQEIIEAARQVFADYGYKKVTMDDVAAKLNITRSALYYYYKSKEDLFVAVGEFDFRKYESDQKKAIDSMQTTDERFIAFCRCFLPMRKRFRDIYKLGNDDFYFPMGSHHKFRKMISNIHTALITGIFLNDKKIAGLENVEYYSTLLTYSIRGILFSSYDADPDQLEQDIITLSRIFCQGIPGYALRCSNDLLKKDK